MIAYARHEFALEQREADGSTLRQHYRSWSKQHRRPHPGLAGPACPPELAHVWAWFLDLTGSRTSGFGPAALGWQDYRAWSALTGARPSPYELDCLRALDAAWLAASSKAADDPA